MASILLRRRNEHVFFAASAIILLIFVIIGFGKSYFARGLIFAPLPSLLVQIHGLLYVGWIVLLIAQVGLVSANRVATHRTLGTIMAYWAGAMVLVGPATVIMAFRRASSGLGPVILFGDLAQTLAFALLVGRALWLRRQAAAHKRLMLLATAAIMLPALARWPFKFMDGDPPLAFIGFYFLVPLLLVGWDLATLHRVHRATLVGVGLILLVIISAFLVPGTTTWIHFAAWLKR